MFFDCMFSFLPNCCSPCFRDNSLTLSGLNISRSCTKKHSISRSGYLPKFHQMLLLPQKGTIRHHEIQILPRKVTLQQQPRFQEAGNSSKLTATLLSATLALSATLLLDTLALSATLLSATLTLSYSTLSYLYSQLLYSQLLHCLGEQKFVYLGSFPTKLP